VKYTDCFEGFNMDKQSGKRKENDSVRHFFWLFLLLALAAAIWSQVLPAQVRADTPIITIRPTIISPPWVNIPDANLKVALHTLCGVPMIEELTRFDLAGLTGTLNIVGKGIANLEGIQYCTNISTLSSSNNPISSLPDMTGIILTAASSLPYRRLSGRSRSCRA
jgi:hypothetical protein